ncbi:MAG: glycosyltransferase family 39 protein [Endomicrobiales bacterium]|nr:glycosyltransferase family 39 protein [Endomicrobiales bacterium]
MFKNHYLNLLSLIFLTLILFLPFVKKPISIDSIFYIYTARQITRDPVRPFNFEINTAGKIHNAWDVANNPPFGSYIMASVIKLFGESELSFHLAFLLFTMLSVLGIYLLAAELGINPFFSSLLLIASPCFFVNAADVMLDVPMLSFILCGTGLIVYGAKRDLFGSMIFGWIVLSAAIFTKFSAVFTVLPVFLWLYLNKKPARYYFPVVIPSLVVILWSVHNMFFYGETQLFGKSGAVGFYTLLVKEIPLINYIGGALIMPLGILLTVITLKRKYIYAFAVLFLILNVFFSMLKYSVSVSVMMSFLFCCGIFFVFMAVSHFIKYIQQKEVVFLSAWFFVYLVFFAGISSIIAVRYLMPLLPAAILLFVFMNQNRRWLIVTTIFLGVALSLLIGHSDYMWASSYKKSAEYVKANYKGDVFFAGYLGFQYYMEKNGFTAVVSDKDDYPGGSFFVSSVIPVPQKLHEKAADRLELIEEKYFTTRNPARTIHPMSQAGFHLNLFGLLPYSFSKKPLEKISIYRIK